MTESTESEYYNTTYVLYENNTVETNELEAGNDTESNHSAGKSPERGVDKRRRAKKQEDQKSLYDEDLYSLPQGAKVTDISNHKLEMDQICPSNKSKGSKSYMGIVGVVIGIILTVAMGITVYLVLQKNTKGRILMHS